MKYHIWTEGSDNVSVAPLPNFDIVRDLVPDLGSMFDHHTALKPFLIRPDATEQENPRGEYGQTTHEMEEYLQFSYCIKCGCCMAACPTRATDPEYSGPMPLAAAHRYNRDSRDAGFAVRKKILSGGAGPWRYHFAGECSSVCSKGVDPAKAIQLMKRELVGICCTCAGAGRRRLWPWRPPGRRADRLALRA